MDKTIIGIRSISISNKLYGSDSKSLLEIYKGSKNKLVASRTPDPISPKLVKYRDTIFSECKQSLIMRFKKSAHTVANSRGLVQGNKRTGNENKGKWTSPHLVQFDYRSAGTGSVSGLNGHRIL